MDDFTQLNQVLPRETVKASYYSAVKGDSGTDPKKIGGMFESIFYRMIFKEMRNSSLDEGLFDSEEFKTVREMQDNEMAEHLGQEGKLGIVQIIEDFAKKSEGENTVKPEDFAKSFSLPGLLKEKQS